MDKGGGNWVNSIMFYKDELENENLRKSISFLSLNLRSDLFDSVHLTLVDPLTVTRTDRPPEGTGFGFVFFIF